MFFFKHNISQLVRSERNQHEEGFTLLENLIALSIVVIGGLAVFALLSQTLLSSRTNQDQIIEINLAREGIEIVRSIRDSSDLGYAALVDGSWIVDSADNYSLTTPADDANVVACLNCQLYITNGQYSHTPSAEMAPFKRVVTIENGNHIASCVGGGNACEKMVTVSVLRPGSLNPYKLVTYITDWK